MAQRNRAFSRAGIEVTHPNAAGVDVGGATHYAAVRPDIDEPVRSFNCFTADLNAMADWFEQCGVTIVAMESTGVYWIRMRPAKSSCIRWPGVGVSCPRN